LQPALGHSEVQEDLLAALLPVRAHRAAQYPRDPVRQGPVGPVDPQVLFDQLDLADLLDPWAQWDQVDLADSVDPKQAPALEE